MTALVSLFIYWHGLNSYFFQDDWYSLGISEAKSVKDVIRFFIPRSDVIYYRPFGMQLPFYLFSTLFGLTPIPFKLTIFALLIASSFLVYLLVKHILKNQTVALVSLLLYGTSAVHFMPIYWSATFAFMLGTFFYLLSFLTYIKGNYKNSFALFIIGLFTNELLVTFPLILIIWNIWQHTKIDFRKIVLFFVPSIFYVFLRFTLVPAPTEGDYAFTLNLFDVMRNFKYYLLWVFNWPETIQDQFVSFFILSPTFIRDFMVLVIICGVLTFFFAASSIYAFFRQKTKLNILPTLVFGLLWFLCTLLPVLFFSKHSFPYYAQIPLFGMLLMWASVWATTTKKNKQITLLASCVLVVMWLLASLHTVDTNKFIHWAPRRAELSKKLTAQFPSPSQITENNIIVVNTTNEENKWALGDQNAAEYLFKDEGLYTFYGSLEEFENSDFRHLTPIVVYP